jgi:transcriptional regulator GlxA family with amidase domain
MSRATLVRRFQDAVGVAPMTYIKNWRMMKAYGAIKYTHAPLEEIAASMGFASARTLAKAFERQYGFTPTELRRTAQTPPNSSL